MSTQMMITGRPALLPQLIAMYAPAFIIQHIVYGSATGLLRPQPYAPVG